MTVMHSMPETDTIPRGEDFFKPEPGRETVALFEAIEAALPEGVRVVQIASCHDGEGATTVSRELAALAAQSLDRRALLVDIKPDAISFADRNRRSLLDLAAGARFMDAVERADGARVYDHACLVGGDSTEAVLPNLHKLKQIVDFLRDQFGLVILNTPGILNDPMAARLGALADGVVLVIEAEHTRAPVTKQALNMLEAGGARPLGVVLNKRRYRIPSWLYRHL